MGSRQHYVSQFHLRGFTDPSVTKPQDPWLWVGDCTTGSIERRAPKNLAWSTDLFAGPGGLADREGNIEAHLATHVEGPAAFALRGFVSRPRGERSAVPGEVGRYLAWAAARSVSMRQLYQAWIDDLPDPTDAVVVEPPPPGFEHMAPVTRGHRMEHPELGIRDDVPSEDVELLRREGWRFLLTNGDFLELVHLQAWYFQVRFFSRLRWIILDAPHGGDFIVGDRPVVWGFDGVVGAQPSALRHPQVQLFAPLTRSVALFAHHPSVSPPRAISYHDVNRVLASAATDWIAGGGRGRGLGRFDAESVESVVQREASVESVVHARYASRTRPSSHPPR
ncbi:MAG: DUF4238 domain-containing protein [Vicinamibacterales bacterium]